MPMLSVEPGSPSPRRTTRIRGSGAGLEGEPHDIAKPGVARGPGARGSSPAGVRGPETNRGVRGRGPGPRGPRRSATVGRRERRGPGAATSWRGRDERSAPAPVTAGVPGPCGARGEDGPGPPGPRTGRALGHRRPHRGQQPLRRRGDLVHRGRNASRSGCRRPEAAQPRGDVLEGGGPRLAVVAVLASSARRSWRMLRAPAGAERTATEALCHRRARARRPLGPCPRRGATIEWLRVGGRSGRAFWAVVEWCAQVQPCGVMDQLRPAIRSGPLVLAGTFRGWPHCSSPPCSRGWSSARRRRGRQRGTCICPPAARSTSAPAPRSARRSRPGSRRRTRSRSWPRSAAATGARSAPRLRSGSSWYRISAVNGTSVRTLFGVSYLYGATGVLKPAPVPASSPDPTPTLAPTPTPCADPRAGTNTHA